VVIGNASAGRFMTGGCRPAICSAGRFRPIDQARTDQAFVEKFRGLRPWLDAVANVTDKIQDVAAAPSGTPAQEVVVRQPVLPTWLVLITWYPLQLAITLVATLVIAVFLMASGDLFYEKLVKFRPL
jgi:hypothetical protein